MIQRRGVCYSVLFELLGNVGLDGVIAESSLNPTLSRIEEC
jgi:hypothetical protein